MPKKQKHPLRVSFAEYLSSLPPDAVHARLGAARAEAWRNGLLDPRRFIAPPAGDTFTVDDLKRRDIDAFSDFHRGLDGSR